MCRNPKQWGPYGWRFIHSIAVLGDNLDTTIQENMKTKRNIFEIMKLFPYILPCPICVASATKWAKSHKLPEYTKSDTAFGDYI